MVYEGKTICWLIHVQHSSNMYIVIIIYNKKFSRYSVEKAHRQRVDFAHITLNVCKWDGGMFSVLNTNINIHKKLLVIFSFK